MIPWQRQGRTGWALVALGILAWDLTAAQDQTLSESFRRGFRRHPASYAVVVLTWGALTAHLWDVIPPRADPLHMIHVARDLRRTRRALAA